jgi:hypothetical protein
MPTFLRRELAGLPRPSGWLAQSLPRARVPAAGSGYPHARIASGITDAGVHPDVSQVYQQIDHHEHHTIEEHQRLHDQ